MKSTAPEKLLQLLVILIITITVSCKKEMKTDEVKINDFQSLAAEFKNPPAEYTTAPFFVWNYKISKEEIDRFLADFKDQGSSQVFVHPRPGLITEYLSDEWFDLFRYTVAKGKELGMKVWIYDENSYPSGFAGGHVPDRMPESFNQGQGLKMTVCETLPDTAGKYFICLREDGNQFTDITSSLENEKGKKGRYLLFSKTYNSPSDWYGGFSYVDLLYSGVTQKFLNVTMEGYEKSILEEFGKTIPGIFTDEPQISSPGGIRWTPDLFDVFKKMWNYDLRTCLPLLFEEKGDWKKVRHNYTSTLLQLFIDRWAKPYFEYCDEKGLIFTGHYWEHEWPSMRQGGDNMAMYAWHHMPGIDMLFNQWNDSTPRAQFGNVRSVKELASAANQTGRQRKLSETYGGSGWELTFEEMKRNGDWEYALGVNLMNQHLTYFSLAGARKYDYPPSFDYHEPWWNNYKYVNDHFSRLSLVLSAGIQKNEILVLEPTTTAWMYDSYTKRNEKMTEIGQAFQSFITRLEKNQVEYDLGSENIIKDRGSVKDDRFVVGNCIYSTVVIPPLMENLDQETYKLINRFVQNGGRLIAFSTPSLVNGSENENLKQFFLKHNDKIITENSLTPEAIDRYFVSGNISFEGFGNKYLYHHRRILSDGQILFMANSSLDDPLKGSVSTEGVEVIGLNTITGEISGHPCIRDGKNVTFNIELPPAGSLLVYIPEKETGIQVSSAPPEEEENVEPYSAFQVTRDEDNAVAIEFCDLLLGGEMRKDLHTYDAADMVYKYHGFKNGNPWNHSVQFKTNIIARDTFGTSTGFTATYYFNVRGKFDYSSFKAAIERPALWTITVNGQEVNPVENEWWLDREIKVFSIGSLVKEGINAITLKASPFSVNAEIEPVYIRGNFSVKPAVKGWTIEAPAGSLKTGSWKEQGMPFYSWCVTYSREYNIEDAGRSYVLQLGDWKGTCAGVKVNGQPAGIIAFPPYRLDLTSFIKTGINKIEVQVTGSLKNLMGPHFNNPDPGLASPWLFRNVKSYPPGAEYQLLDYGLLQEFELRTLR